MRAVWLMLLLAWVGAAGDSRSFADSRLLLDRRLETLRRILPDGATPGPDQALLRELADGARLRGFDVRPGPPLEAGSAGEITFDIQAAGRFEEIERFFRQLALTHRPADVEVLTLTGTPGGLRFSAQVRFPHWPARAPLPAPPEGTRARLGGVPRPQADAYVRDQALALAKSEVISAWRRSRRNPRLFLSELAAVVRDRPVVLGHAELRTERERAASPAAEHAFAVRGLTLGDGPARALESRFERGFFRLREFLMARQGGCVRFEARGLSPVVGSEAALPLPSDDPFVQDDTPCRVDRDPESARLPPAKAAASGKNAAGGPLTLRLRDVDLAEVFFALHALTGAGFLVDGDVAGRASVEFARVTLAEALEALQKSAGLRLASAGGLWRVALDRKTALPPVPAAGGTPAISFALKRAETRDVLAVMSEADPAYASLGPPGFLGRVSLWVANAPLSDVRALLLASAGLGERLEDGRRVLERGANDEPPVPVAAVASERRLELSPHELTVGEFEVAGVGTSGQGYLAFAHSPTGKLLAYRAGDVLADGKVREIQSTDVLVDTDEGPLRLLIAPLK
jgi:hypothetical protein